MRLRLPLIIAALAAAALTVGLVAVAGADDDTELPPLTAPELLARMTSQDEGPASVSGELVWKNRLFGDVPAFGDEAFADVLQSPLLSDGSGRLWAQDRRVRFDAYTRSGDQVAVVDGAAGTAWVYDGVRDTATLYEVDRGSADGAQEPALGSPATGAPLEAPTPERIAGMLAGAARFMAVEVTGESVVAGRDVYLLTMTPAAADTALGSVQAAIDGGTFVPLRVDVTARGADEPALSFGFERISYASVDDDVFAFSPPAGAEVARETIALDGADHGDDPEGEDSADRPSREELGDAARRALLDLDQAGALVDFELRAAEGYTARDFRWAYVIDGGLPLDAAGAPVFGDLLGAMGDPTATGDDGDGPPPEADAAAEGGPAAVLLYGEGFGAIALAQTRTTPEVRERLGELPALFAPGSAAGVPTRALLTPLGGAAVWEDGGVTFVAFGLVPGQDLLEFIGSVR